MCRARRAQARRCQLARTGRRGARRHRWRPVGSDGRRRRCRVPRAQHRRRRGLGGARTRTRRELPRRGRTRRCRPHRVPRRAGRRRHGAERAPRESSRGRPRAGGRAGRVRGAACGGDHRLGLGQLRDAALPHRGAPGDGHPTMGAHRVPADRDPRRAAVPGRRRRAPGADRWRARDRWPRRPLVRRHDGDVRRSGRPPAPSAGPGPGAVAALSSLWVGLVTPVPAQSRVRWWIRW